MNGKEGAFAAIAGFLTEDRQTSSALDETDSVLARLGCLVALAPDSSEIENLFSEALQKGVSTALLEAAVIHSIGYVGILAASSADDLLQAAITRSNKENEKLNPPEISADFQERAALGYRLYGRFDAARAAQQQKIYDDISAAYYPRAMEFAGFVLRFDEISLRQRQIITIAMLSALGVEPQLKFHIGVALKNDVTREQIAGILLFVQIFAGLPRANSAAVAIREALLEH